VLAGSWPEAAPFEEALLSGNHREALAVVNSCFDNGHHLVDIEMYVIRPALYNIGEKWQFNQITIAQEHLATAIAQSVMTMGLLRSRRPTPNGRRILLACVEGNNHDIGLRMIADAFLLAGWDMQFLGANVPNSALILHATQWKPDLVGLSISLPQQMRAIKEIVAQLSEQFGSGRPAVMIGGAAVNGCNRLASIMPADWHHADAPAAVIGANRLVGEASDSRKPG
jgi:methanogenic corrinoid protein MtbC1